jgi:hypothetical protein
VKKLRLFEIAGAFAAVLALSGCYEPVGGVTVYEPGEYKGQADPLLKSHARPESKTALQERFQQGQTDR